MAGGYPTQTLQPKTICRVTTGAPVPDGANAVIKVRLQNYDFCPYTCIHEFQIDRICSNRT